MTTKKKVKKMTEETKKEEAAEPETKKPSKPPKKTALDKVLQEKAQTLAPAPTQKWAISNIVLPEKWNRVKVEKDATKMLMTSIKAQGQIVPLLVRKTDNPAKVELVDGRRRYEAMKELGIKQAIIAFTDDKNDDEAHLTALVANAAREGHTDYELALSYKALIDSGMSSAEVAAAVGVSEGYVSQRTAIFKHDPRLIQLLQKGTIPLATIRYLAPLKLDNPEDKKVYDKIVEKIVLKTISPTDVEALVDKYKGEQKVADVKSGKTPAKKKPGPKIEKLDFASKEVRKQVKPLNPDKGLKLAQEYSDLADQNRDKVKRARLMGIVQGIELMLGLAEETKL